jgi:hypothetical protein
MTTLDEGPTVDELIDRALRSAVTSLVFQSRIIVKQIQALEHSLSRHRVNE